MSLDEISDVVADGFIDDNPRELLDDAMFNAELPSIVDRHRRWKREHARSSCLVILITLFSRGAGPVGVWTRG